MQSVCIDKGSFFVGNNETSALIAFALVSSTVGLILSVIAFILLIVTAVLFKEWRSIHKNQILIQLMFARLLYTIMRYSYDVRNIINACDEKCVIYLDAIALMYTECVLIAWMFMFTKNLNDSLVKVFYVSDYSLWKLSLWTWFIPGVISGLLNLAFDRQTDKELMFYLLYLFILKWPVLFANAILLIAALKAVIQTNKSKVENNKRIIFVMIVLIFGFSVQQLIIDTYKIVFLILSDNYVNFYLNLFNILTIYHCAFSILFWLFGNAKTRKLWRFQKPKLDSSKNLSISVSVQTS